MCLKNYFTLILLLGTLLTVAQPPAYVPTQGLLAWWGMTDATDATGNGNTLTPFNVTTTTDRFGTPNAAYSFNGTNSYLTRSPMAHNFTQAGSFSVSIWLRKTTASSGVAIMTGTSASANFIWLIQTSATTVIFGTNKQQSAWFWTNATTNFVLSQWEHYVGVYTGNKMTFYRNGVLQGETINTHTNVSQASLPVWIGRAIDGGYFNGSLDDIGLWTRALTPNEVAILYQSSLSSNTLETASVKIYPNPANDFLQVETTADDLGKTFQIFDEIGRIINTGHIADTVTKINTTSLMQGIYFFKVGGNKTVKFIKS